MPQIPRRKASSDESDRLSSSGEERDAPSSATRRNAEIKSVLGRMRSLGRELTGSGNALLQEVGKNLCAIVRDIEVVEDELGLVLDRFSASDIPADEQPESSDAFIMSDRFAETITARFRDAAQRAVVEQLARGESVRGRVGGIEVQISPSPSTRHRQIGD